MDGGATGGDLWNVPYILIHIKGYRCYSYGVEIYHPQSERQDYWDSRQDSLRRDYTIGGENALQFPYAYFRRPKLILFW